MDNGKERESGIFINGLDLIDILSFIKSKNKRYMAMTLQDIEGYIGKDHPNYTLARKAILDGFNNYTRSLVRAIFSEEIEEPRFDG